MTNVLNVLTEQEYRQYQSDQEIAAARMHVRPRGVVADTTAWGEPTGHLVDSHPPRLAVDLRIYVTADELAAATADDVGLWEEGPEAASLDVLRWKIMSALLMAGGPDSPQVYELSKRLHAEAQHDHEGRDWYREVSALVTRAFGVTPAALPE